MNRQQELFVAIAPAFWVWGLLRLAVRDKLPHWHFPLHLFEALVLLLRLFRLIFLAVLSLILRHGRLELFGLRFGLSGLVKNLENFGVRNLRVRRQILARHLLNEFQLFFVHLVLGLVCWRFLVQEKLFFFRAIH